MSEPIRLESGAELRITPAKFEDANELYQACLDALKGMKLDPEMDIDFSLMKDLFCTGFSNKRIEIAFWKCAEKSLYNGLKINKSTFEPVEAREDFLIIYAEVVKETISPFLKSLSAALKSLLSMASKSGQA